MTCTMVRSFLTLSLVGLLMAGCGIDSKLGETLNPPTASKTPIARIEISDTKVLRGSVVLLKGNGSTDPQSSALTYAWTVAELPTGSTAAITTATASVISLTLDKGGFYSITLVVTNAGGTASNPVSTRLEVVGIDGVNHPPVAVAGADLTGTTTNVVVLDGSGSFDADQTAVTYMWDMVGAPATSALTNVTIRNEARTYFTPDVAGTYTLKLKVSDGIDTDEDIVVVTVT